MTYLAQYYLHLTICKVARYMFLYPQFYVTDVQGKLYSYLLVYSIGDQPIAIKYKLNNMP